MTSQISPNHGLAALCSHTVMQQEGIKMKSKEITMKAEPPQPEDGYILAGTKDTPRSRDPTAGRGRLSKRGVNSHR